MKGKVAVVGAGMIKFGEHYDKSYLDLIAEAYLETLKSVDKGIDRKEIQAGWLGTVLGTPSGSSLTEATALLGLPATRCESVCVTGCDAFRNAAFSVAAGVYDLVLVIGAEHLHAGALQDMPIGGGSPHEILDYGMFGAPALFGLWPTRHMHEFGTTKEQMAMIAVKNHRNGAKNPLAHFQYEIKVEDVLKSPLVCWPFNRLDCCPFTDGAAGLILCRSDLAKKYTDAPVYLAGIGLGTDTQEVFDKINFIEFYAAVQAAKQAYKMAGVEPKDIDVAEVHDCFTSTELILYEDLGFCKKGEGGKFIQEGQPEIGGKIAVNPSGGLKAKGHPWGATGVAQIYEIFKQLRGEAGKRQQPGAEIGLQNNVGAIGVSAAGVTIHTISRP